MKKLMKVVILAAMIMCMGATSAFAGDSSYAVAGLTNYKGSYSYRVLTSSPNTKATKNADWFFRVDKIAFSMNTSGTYGMIFTPTKKSGSSYVTAGADYGWAKASFSSYEYHEWNGYGTAKVTYYLGARLDTLLTTGSASSSGVWNAN